MFNLGPMEIAVIVIVGLIVLGPDKLPEMAREAGRMLRTLRDMANGARSQLRDELGPEFADVDLRNLNPRTAIQRAVLGDEDLSDLNPRTLLQGIMDDEPAERGVSMTKPADARPVSMTKPDADAGPKFDPDAT